MFTQITRENRTNDALLCSMLSTLLKAPKDARRDLATLGAWQRTARPDDVIQLEETAVIRTRRPWLAEFTHAVENAKNFAQYIGEVELGTWMIAQDVNVAGNAGLLAMVELAGRDDALNVLRDLFATSRRPFMLLATTQHGRVMVCTRLSLILK